MSNKNFSIIVPYYNSDLEQTKCCLNSLILQNFSLLKEIIVVNDGSNEKNKSNLITTINNLNIYTYTLKNQNQQIQPLIKIIHQENLGLAKARYTGFKNSIGDIVLFVDSDDWICDNKLLDKLNKYFKTYKNIKLIKYNYKATFISKTKQINNQKVKIKKCKIDIK